MCRHHDGRRSFIGLVIHASRAATRTEAETDTTRGAGPDAEWHPRSSFALMDEFQLWLQRLDQHLEWLRRSGRGAEPTQVQRRSVLQRWIRFALEQDWSPGSFEKYVVIDFLDHQDDLGDHTRETYSRIVDQWISWVTDTVSEEVADIDSVDRWMQRLEEFLDHVKAVANAPDPANVVADLRSVVSRWILFSVQRHTSPEERNEPLLREWVTKELALEIKPQGDYRSRVRRWWKWCEAPGHQTAVPKCWLVRAGSEGEAFDHNLKNDVVSIGYGYQGDLGSLARHATTRDELGDRIDEQFGDLSEGKRRRARDEIWRFVRDIQFGDLVIMPMKSEGTDAKPIAIGRIDGPYEFDPEQSEQVRCRRPVTWLRIGIERSAIGEDLRSSLNARFTVLELHHHDAARRIHHLARHGFDPGLRDTESQADQSQSVRLAQLVAEFRGTGYPGDDDHQHELARAGFEQILRSLPETAHNDREAVKAVWNPAEFDYGSVGYAGAGANRLVNNASAQDWSQIHRELAEVCFGSDDEATRLDRAAESGDLRGVRYVIGTRLLAICQPHDVIPIYLLRKSRKYPGVIDMIEVLDRLDLIGEDHRQAVQDLLSLSGADLNSGAVVMQANDLLLETLRPHFSDDGDVDTWGMSKFLYWVMERHPGDRERDKPWIYEGDLAALAEELLCDVGFLKDIVALLEDKGQVILYGPPGTGKTYFAHELAWELTEYGDSDVHEAYSLVQFHPAYSYEDFFEGFRPQADGNGQMTYELKPGPLVRLAERAEKHPNELHVMVIDEINRANLPRVLGEMLYLLEYRNESIQTQYRPEEDFSLPENLWFIGTMNTADRSIALIDAAIRRRFHFVKFSPNDEPTKSLLRQWLGQHAPSAMWVADLLDGVNAQLAAELGDDHLLVGPSHFMTTSPDRDLTEDGVRRIWTYNIEPLIEDQFFGRQEVIRRFRFDEVWKDHGPGATAAESETGTADGSGEDAEPSSVHDENTKSNGDG